MVFGSSSLDVEPSLKQEMARQRVNETAEKYGLDLDGELRDVDVDYLGRYTNAVTEAGLGGASVTFDEQSFFQRPEHEQEMIALEELLHVKQFNGTLDDWANRQLNISDGFTRELGSGYKDTADLEGEAQVLIDNLMPYETIAYPYEKMQKERELKSKGIDPEEEIDVETDIGEDLDGLEEQVYEDQKDIYDFAVDGGVYFEAGTMNGLEYSFMALGDGMEIYGPEIAEMYRETLSALLDPGQREKEEEYFDENAMEEFGDYWESLERTYDQEAEYTGEEERMDYIDVREMQTPMNPDPAVDRSKVDPTPDIGGYV